MLIDTLSEFSIISDPIENQQEFLYSKSFWSFIMETISIWMSTDRRDPLLRKAIQKSRIFW